MKPNNIFLIRHGESEGNADKKSYLSRPDYAMRLTAKGIQQAQEAGAIFNDLIPESHRIRYYISPFWRTRQTYQNLKKSLVSHESVTTEDPRIREQEWGTRLRTNDDFLQFVKDNEETSNVEVERDSYGHFYYRFDNGESCADVYDRISSFLDSFWRDFEKETKPWSSIIVTHGMTLRLFIMKWFHLSVEEFELLKNPKNCQIAQLKLNRQGKYELVKPMETYEAPTHEWQYDWKVLG